MKKLLLLGALALIGLTSKAEAPLVDGYVDRSDWTITACSWISEGGNGKSGPVTAIYDDDLATYYHQSWASDTGRGTHWLVIDMGEEQTISGVDIWGRQDNDNGHILAGKVYVSTTPFEAFTADANAAAHDAAKAYYANADNIAAGTISYELNDATRNNVQSVRFNETVARYVLILSDQTSNNSLCISEIQVRSKVLPRVDLDRTGWTATACSEAADLEGNAGGYIANIFDDNLDTFYHQNWSGDKASDAYHWFVIDMGSSKKVDGFKYWRRQESANGQIYAGKVYVSDTEFPTFESHSGDTNDAKTYYENAANVAAGKFTFTYDKNADMVRICDFEQSATGRYVLVIVSDAGMANGGRHLCCSEFKLFKYHALNSVWEAALDATLITRARNLGALGSFIGKGAMPSTEIPDDLTEANLREKAEAVNSALQAYINSFENQLIYIRHASRRQNAYLTAVPRGNSVGLNTTTDPTADAVWQIRFLNNDAGFYLYNRTTNMWVTTVSGAPAMLTETATELVSRLNNAGNLLFVQADGRNGFNIDEAANDLVWHGTGDAGSQWTAEATGVDNQIFADPEVSTAEAPKYYRLVNARWMKNQAASNMSVHGENQDGNGIGEINSRSNALGAGIYWRLEAAGEGEGVKLVNLTGYELTQNYHYNEKNELVQTPTTTTENGTTVYIIKQTADQFHDVNAYGISTTPEPGFNCLDVSGSNAGTFCWSPTYEGYGNGDNGSAWYFLLASDSEIADATANYISEVKARMDGDVVADIDNMVALAGKAGAADYVKEAEVFDRLSTIASVNEAKRNGTSLSGERERLTQAVKTILDEYIVGQHVQLSATKTGWNTYFMKDAAVGEATQIKPTQSEDEFETLWLISKVENGYKLTNEATGRMIGFGQNEASSVWPTVTNEADAQTFVLNYNPNMGKFSIRKEGTTEDDHRSIHLAWNNANDDCIKKWLSSGLENSHWYISALAEPEVEVIQNGQGGHCVRVNGEFTANANDDDELITIYTLPETAAGDETEARMRRAAPAGATVHATYTVGAVRTSADQTVAVDDAFEVGKAYFMEVPGAKLTTADGKHTRNLFTSFSVGSDGTVTGVKTVVAPAEPVAEVYYDLQGRRVTNPGRGLYICNGRKVFIR